MSTSAPDSAAQLLFLFLMVIVTAIGSPERSERISFMTNELGVLVGNGPSVSEFVTVQFELDEPLVEPCEVVEPEVVEVGSTVSLLQELTIGTTVAMPNTDKLLFKNSLRSIFV